MGGVLLDTSIDLALSFGEISEKQAKELHRLLERSVKDQERKMREQEERELREENKGSNQRKDNQQRRYLEEMMKDRLGKTDQDDSVLVQQLRVQIDRLEKKTDKTAQQEQELIDKKKKLAELEAKFKELENKTDNSSGNKDKEGKMALYIGGGIVGLMDISRSGLEGDLIIEDFVNLERIDCQQNQITSLNLINLPKLIEVLNKLEDLNIAGTNVEKDGLEYLSDSLKEISSVHSQKLTESTKLEGNLQGFLTYLSQVNKTLFEEKEKQINLLELRIQELTNSIKELKEKIVNAYLYLAPEQEKELLKELITAHLEIARFRELKRPLNEYREQRKSCNALNKKLKEKWEKLDEEGEELIEKVEIILKDCEELVTWEIELENKLSSKQLLSGKQRKFPLITFGVDQPKPTLEYLIGKGGYGEEETKKITNEVNILQSLRNRHIIQYYGLYSDNQEFLIIMDYAKNGTLTKFINDNKDKEYD
ncbi:2737_t:CDS:2 [Cetraspora pellucida]|uniref:2737_t:CDS:1 n=1 Tax=Cetraspora pellucida TaxID=1433469 RepID=A0ACA9MJ21_9GLOM|nr:2737_t:CDS:2 [Cetraspora pellucida]